MKPIEALRFLSRWAPCLHEDTGPVGYGDTKCHQCDRIWPKCQEIKNPEFDAYEEAYNIVLAALKDLEERYESQRGAILEFDRRHAAEGRYNRLFEQARKDGRSVIDAHLQAQEQMQAPNKDTSNEVD
jgi:hypothetical protein